MTRPKDFGLPEVDIEPSIGLGAVWGGSVRRPQAKGVSKVFRAKTGGLARVGLESFIRNPPLEERSHRRLAHQTRSLNLGDTTMQQTRARQILQSLIQGIDPVTGEELPRETVLQHADVLRALLSGLSALEQTAARAMRRAQLPDNVGRAWTTEEESRLVAAFKRGDSPVALAHEHGRTLRAIEARLEKLSLITAEQRTTRGGFTGQV